MKKKIFTLLALFACVLSASADNTITVSEALVTKGGTGTFNVELTNSDEFKGFTMFLTLPDGINLVSVTSNPARMNDMEDPTGSNPYGLGYIAMKPITGTSGAIFSVTVSADASLAAGAKLDAKLDKITFGKSDGSGDVSIADVNFKIEITDKVILDENSLSLPAAQSGVNVLVKRTIAANQWHTICLPFEMTEAQLKTAFGDDVKLCYLNTKNAYAVDGNKITVNFADWTLSWKLRKNYPLLIKTSKDIAEFEVDNVTIDPDESAAESTIKWDKESSEPPFDMETFAKFKGTLKSGTIIPADNLFLSNNKFYYSKGSTSIKAFRGYFWLKDFKSSSSAPEIYIDVDGETTKVEGLNVIFDDGSYYNLNGMKIENPTKKGVYIQNGKKVVVK